MQVVRSLFPRARLRNLFSRKRRGRNPQLFTFKTDGSEIVQAVSREQWALGGNHPNWHPDGEQLIMNLKPDGKNLRFCQFRYDGKDFKVLSESKLASGHPSVNIGGRYLISDAYPHEPFVLDNEEVPIRLLDLQNDTEETICTIYTLGKGMGMLRCDPHPAWDRTYKRVCFNGTPDGRRQVFIADLTEVI